MSDRDRTAPAPGRRVRRSALAWLLGAALMRTTFWAPEVCPALTTAQARTASVAAGAWLTGNQDEAGRYSYEYDRGSATWSADYNIVRHAGVTMSLYQLVGAGEEQFLAPADRGLAWMLDRLRPAGDAAVAFSESGTEAKLGASALLAVSLAQRRLATGDTAHDEAMIDLGRFLTGQQRPDGSVLDRFDLTANAPVPDRTSIYSTGEANWALALLHEAFPEEGFDQAARATLRYLATARDRVEGFAPAPWPDQWAAYSLAEMVEWGLSDAEIDYARRLLARYATIVRWDSQRGTPYGSLTHGPAARGAGFGTWIEGVASLHRTAVADDRLADVRGVAGEVLSCGAARLAARQEPPGPDAAVAGAWFYDGATRMDDQQHAASGLLAAEAVLP